MSSIPLFLGSIALARLAHLAPPRSVPGALFVCFAVSLAAFGLFVLMRGRK